MWYASFGLVPSPLDTFRCLFVQWGCAWYSRGLSLFFGFSRGARRRVHVPDSTWNEAVFYN